MIDKLPTDVFQNLIEPYLDCNDKMQLKQTCKELNSSITCRCKYLFFESESTCLIHSPRYKTSCIMLLNNCSFTKEVYCLKFPWFGESHQTVNQLTKLVYKLVNLKGYSKCKLNNNTSILYTIIVIGNNNVYKINKSNYKLRCEDISIRKSNNKSSLVPLIIHYQHNFDKGIFVNSNNGVNQLIDNRLTEQLKRTTVAAINKHINARFIFTQYYWLFLNNVSDRTYDIHIQKSYEVNNTSLNINNKLYWISINSSIMDIPSEHSDKNIKKKQDTYVNHHNNSRKHMYKSNKIHNSKSKIKIR